jgi:hypothetical protein
MGKHVIAKASVSGAAVIAAAAIPVTAQAADPVPIPEECGYYFALEGGALFGESPFDASPDKLGEGGDVDRDNFDDELGFRGAAAFGQCFPSGFDWRIGVAVSQFMNNDASLSSAGGGSGSADYESDFDYETVDLELGFRPNMDGLSDLRLFAGLRFLHSEDSLDKLGTVPIIDELEIDSETEISTEFFGIGPRGGFDFATGTMGEGPFGISGMAAASVIFGKRDFECDGDDCDEADDDDDDDETIFNLEAALGFDLHLSETSKVTIGYRGEYWDNLIGSEDVPGDKLGDISTDKDLLVHGPFLKFVSEF